jgi:hypothetical protein
VSITRQGRRVWKPGASAGGAGVAIKKAAAATAKAAVPANRKSAEGTRRGVGISSRIGLAAPKVLREGQGTAKEPGGKGQGRKALRAATAAAHRDALDSHSRNPNHARVVG